MMRYQKEILQLLNMLYKIVNKYFVPKQTTIERHVEVFRSHDRRDDHEGYRKSIIIIR